MTKEKQSPFSFKKKSRDRKKLDLHTTNLFDENEDIYGQRYNDAIGIAIDNSSSQPTENAMVALHEVESDGSLKDPQFEELMKDPEIVELFNQFEQDLIQADLDAYMYKRNLRKKKLAKRAFKGARKSQ